jgi:hypothetical protein
MQPARYQTDIARYQTELARYQAGIEMSKARFQTELLGMKRNFLASNGVAWYETDLLGMKRVWPDYACRTKLVLAIGGAKLS